jgi:hypothetical protein
VHPYRPFDEKQFRHRIAARPLELAEWIEVDNQFDEFMAEKEPWAIHVKPPKKFCR